MAYVTVTQLNEYTGNEETSTLKEVYIASAEEVIKDYLGYDPLIQEYTHIYSGVGDYRLYLKAQPIVYLASITIDDEEYDVEDFTLDGFSIYKTDYENVFTSGLDNIVLEYTAGYDDVDLPGIIQLTTLRIASLMLQESGGNIGISGKTFADTSRSFINYSDYKKYLKPLDSLRIIRI